MKTPFHFIRSASSKLSHGLGPLLLVVLLLLLAGCGTQPQPAARKFAGAFRPPADARESAMAPPAMERPGLGTGWGEERESYTTRASFVRAHPKRPSATDRFFYNDRAGVEAMLQFEGGAARRVSGAAPAAGGLVQLGLKGGSGRWLDGFSAHGRRFIVGERGERYEIFARNVSGRWLEVVLSVDGLDVIDGRRASYSKRGYILAPGETLSVDGFRTSTSTVAAFRFSTVSRSYAALRHGDTANVGVIGLAVFEERGAWPRWSGESSRRREANPFPGSRWAQPPP